MNNGLLVWLVGMAVLVAAFALNNFALLGGGILLVTGGAYYDGWEDGWFFGKWGKP